jgi:peptidyl-prolyl cis-trans isomerase C
VSLFIPIASLLALAAGCPPQGAEKGGQPGDKKPKKDPDRELVVATIGGTTRITVGMLEDELNRQNPYMRMRFASPERKREFLKNMVRFEVLAREARRKGLQNDPEVVKRVKRAMIDRMFEEVQGTLVKLEDVTDKEIAEQYAKDRALYQQPAKMRASLILVSTEAEAKKLLAEAKKRSGDSAHFGALAQKNSIDEPSKARRGDLEFFAADDARMPKELREAAFGIKALWDYAGPVKTERGFAILMKTGELEAVNRPLEMEKQRIRNRLYQEKRIKAMEKFVEDLQQKAKVVTNEANLAKVKVDQSGGPPPGHHMGMPGHGHGRMPPGHP